MTAASPVIRGWFTPAQVNQRHKRRTVLVEVDAAQAEILDAAIDAFGRHEQVPLTFAIGEAAEAVALCLDDNPKPPTNGSGVKPAPPSPAPEAAAGSVHHEILAELKGLRGDVGTLNRIAVTVKGRFGL